MKHSKIKVSILFTLVLCMVLSFAMPIMSSAAAPAYADRVVTDLEGIIAYVEDSTSSTLNQPSKTYLSDIGDSVWNKNLEEVLTTLTAAYKTDYSETTLKDIAYYLKAWVWGGHDADKIFFTDKLFGYIVDFAEVIEENNIMSVENSSELAFTWPTTELNDADGNPTGVIVYTFAKRFVSTTDTYKSFWGNSKVEESKGENQLFNHFKALDANLYVAGRTPAAVESKMNATIAAMESATTAKAAFTALNNFFDYINSDGHMVLKAASDAYELAAKVLYIFNNITDGDPIAFEDIEFYVEFINDEFYDGVDGDNLLLYPVSGIVQYRPASQVTSFTEDSRSMTNMFNNLIDEFNAVIEAYAETVEDFDSKIAGFSYTDPFAPLSNSGPGDNVGDGNAPSNPADPNAPANGTPEDTADAMTAVFAVVAILSAGAVLVTVKAKKNYNR